MQDHRIGDRLRPVAEFHHLLVIFVVVFGPAPVHAFGPQLDRHTGGGPADSQQVEPAILNAFRGIGAGKDWPVGVAEPDPIDADFPEAEEFLLVAEQQVDRNVLGQLQACLHKFDRRMMGCATRVK